VAIPATAVIDSHHPEVRFFRLQRSAAAPAGDAGGQRHLTDDRGP
jgi:hypothetical protein